MNVNQVSMLADSQEFFSFSLGLVPTTDKFHVKQIFGLDADEIIRKFTGFGPSSGRRRYSFSVPSRTLTFRAQLNPNFQNNQDYSSIRDELYRAIAANAYGEVTILFRNGGAIVAELTGFIVKFEVPYSSETPEVQFTIHCEDGMLRGPNLFQLDAADFQTIDDPSATVTFSDALSTAPHGINMRIHLSSYVERIYIADRQVDPEWWFELNRGSGWDEDEKFYISSEHQAKKVLYGGVAATEPNQDRMDWVVPGSTFPIVFPRSNSIYIEGWPFDFSSFQIEYRPAYWGL